MKVSKAFAKSTLKIAASSVALFPSYKIRDPAGSTLPGALDVTKAWYSHFLLAQTFLTGVALTEQNLGKKPGSQFYCFPKLLIAELNFPIIRDLGGSKLDDPVYLQSLFARCRKTKLTLSFTSAIALRQAGKGVCRSLARSPFPVPISKKRT